MPAVEHTGGREGYCIGKEGKAGSISYEIKAHQPF
jgi:hypothetical protein